MRAALELDNYHRVRSDLTTLPEPVQSSLIRAKQRDFLSPVIPFSISKIPGDLEPFRVDIPFPA